MSSSSCGCSGLGRCDAHQASYDIDDLKDQLKELQERVQKLEQEPKVVYKTVYIDGESNP